MVLFISSAGILFKLYGSVYGNFFLSVFVCERVFYSLAEQSSDGDFCASYLGVSNQLSARWMPLPAD